MYTKTEETGLFPGCVKHRIEKLNEIPPSCKCSSEESSRRDCQLGLSRPQTNHQSLLKSRSGLDFCSLVCSLQKKDAENRISLLECKVVSMRKTVAALNMVAGEAIPVDLPQAPPPAGMESDVNPHSVE